MISSHLPIRKHPVVVIDDTTTIPDTIANRISFQSCPKIFVNTPIQKGKNGVKYVLVLKEFSMPLLRSLISDDTMETLLAVYAITGLDKNITLNNKVPVIGSEYAKKNGCTDPEEHLESFLSFIATDLGYSTTLVPWKHDAPRWRPLSYGTEFVHITNKVLLNTFPYSVWVASVIKHKQYEQRRKELIAFNKMLAFTPPVVDEIVLFGDDDYLTTERFPQTPGGAKITYNIRRLPKQSLYTLGTIFDYAWKKFPKQSLVYITRSDITLTNQILTQLYCRLPNNVFGVLNPLTVPDVPDPKPEIFQRGVPEVVYGCFYRTKKRPVEEASILSKIHTHMMGSFGVAAELAKQRKISVVNPSGGIQTWVPVGTTPSFINGTLGSIPQVKLETKGIVYANPADTRNVVWEWNDSGGSLTIHPITSVSGGTETKTLVNMTNKYTKRRGGDDWRLEDTNTRDLDIGTVPAFVDATDCIFYKHYWVHNPSGTGVKYNGSGIEARNGNLIVNHDMYHNGVVVGVPDTKTITLVGMLSLIYMYKREIGMPSDLEMRQEPAWIIVPDKCDERGVFLNKLFDGCNVPFKFVNIIDGYVRGKVSIQSNTSTQFIGYDPRIIRKCNRLFQTMDPEETKPSLPIAILVGASKWKKSIQSVIEKHTNIRLIEANDATRADYMRASYLIGTPENDEWIYTIWVDSTKCRVIEIVPEFDGDVQWFHLANTTIGCEHMYLSLKQEPTKQCKKRIKSHLLSYIRETDCKAQ